MRPSPSDPDPRPRRRLLGALLALLWTGVGGAGAWEPDPLERPALEGGSGGFQVLSARPLGRGLAALTLRGRDEPAGTIVTGFRQDRSGGDEGFVLGLTDALEIFASGRTLSTRVEDLSTGEASTLSTLGDLSLGAKAGVEATRWLSLGAMGRGIFLSRVGEPGFDPQAAGGEGRLLADLDLRPLARLPIRLHANGGKAWDRSALLLPAPGRTLGPAGDAALGIFHQDSWIWGGGFEVVAPGVSILAEPHGAIPIGRGTDPEGRGIALGFRALPLGGLAVEGGVDLGFSPPRTFPDGTGVRRSPPVAFFAGVGWEFGEHRAPPATRNPRDLGALSGRVYDLSSLEPIAGAVLTFPGYDWLAFATKQGTGEFWAPGLPTGTLDLVVSRRGYEVAPRRVRLAPGEAVRLDVGLDRLGGAPVAPTGWGKISGTVVDPGGRGLAAVVSIDGALSLVALPPSGEFAGGVPPGDHVVTAYAEGFRQIGGGTPVPMERGGEARLTLVQEPWLPFSRLVRGIAPRAATPAGEERPLLTHPIVALSEKWRGSGGGGGIAPPPPPAGGAEEAGEEGGDLRSRFPSLAAELERRAFERGREAARSEPIRPRAEEEPPPRSFEEFRARFSTLVARLEGRLGPAASPLAPIETVEDLRSRFPALVAEIESQARPRPPKAPPPQAVVVRLPGRAPLVPSLPEGKGPLVPAEARYDAASARIVLSAPLQFKPGGAEVLPSNRNPLLDAVAQVLRDHPRIQVMIEGYTDDRGSDAFNREISRARAERVQIYLVNRGVSPERLRSVGYGKWHPLFPNVDEASRAKNRRVEFKVEGR